MQDLSDAIHPIVGGRFETISRITRCAIGMAGIENTAAGVVVGVHGRQAVRIVYEDLVRRARQSVKQHLAVAAGDTARRRACVRYASIGVYRGSRS